MQRRLCSTARRRRTMMVFASEVPVVSAMNPYRKIEDVFMTTWKRTNPKQVEALEQELNRVVRTPEQKMEEIVEELGVTQPIQSLILEASTADKVADIAQAVAKIDAVLPPSTPAALKTEITQFVASEMNKSFGAKQETPAILAYEQQQQVAVEERNVAFHKKRLASVGAYDLYVGGKIDGRADGKVVEVKNRVSRFMSPLPKYDIAQLQTYLFILNATDGELVEHLRNDKTQTKLTPVPWDKALWEQQIAPFVIRFGSALAHFMKNEDAQKQFLIADEPTIQKEIIRQHWSMEPTD